MPVEALVNNTPVVGLSGGYTGTGAVSGTVYAVPLGKFTERFIEVQITFSADPGAYVFELQGSNDGSNFAILGTNLAATTVPLFVKRDSAKFIRLNQISKANAVTANTLLNLV